MTKVLNYGWTQMNADVAAVYLFEEFAHIPAEVEYLGDMTIAALRD